MDDAHTYSDLLEIQYNIDHYNSRQRLDEEETRPKTNPRMQKTSYFNDRAFTEVPRRGLAGDQFVAMFSRALDATMPGQVHPINGRPPAYSSYGKLALRLRCYRILHDELFGISGFHDVD